MAEAATVLFDTISGQRAIPTKFENTEGFVTYSMRQVYQNKVITIQGAG